MIFLGNLNMGVIRDAYNLTQLLIVDVFILELMGLGFLAFWFRIACMALRVAL